MTANVPVVSPCIGVCIMDAGSGSCRGCQRTLDEIGRWLLYTPAQRDAIMRSLAARRAGAEPHRNANAQAAVGVPQPQTDEGGVHS